MKLKRISALVGVVLLVGLFVLAIILAVTGAPKNYLMAVVFSMVFIPVIIFSMGLMARVLKPNPPLEFPDEAEFSQEPTHPKESEFPEDSDCPMKPDTISHAYHKPEQQESQQRESQQHKN